MNSVFLRRLSNLLYFTIIMFFLGDVFRKFAIWFNLDFNRYTGLSKSIVIFTNIIFVCVFNKEYFKIVEVKKYILHFFFLVSVFVFGQFLLKTEVNLWQSFDNNVLFFCRFSFWPLTFITFFPLIISKGSTKGHLSFFEILFSINLFFILVGFFLDLNIFKTYMDSFRFGFMGLYNTSNQVSYYFIFFLLYQYYRVFYKSKSVHMFYAVLFSAFLIGTKKVYFFLIILFVFHFLKLKLYKQKKFYIICLTLSGTFFLFFSVIKEAFISKFRIFVDLYQTNGFLTSFTSSRDHLLVKTYYEVIRTWNFPNYFLGGPNFSDYRTEFGIVDLYVFFGFFGLYAYYHYFKTLYKLTNFNRFYLFILMAIGLTAFMSSGFLSDANQPLVFFLISSYFISETKCSLEEIV